MWRPGFPYLEVLEGLLIGYHRSFCVLSHHWRGTPEHPGLVLGLTPGGQCRGLVFRVDAAQRAVVLDYLRERELATYAYKELLLPVATSVATVDACVFVADQQHNYFAGGLSVAEAATIIMDASGEGGLNRDYLMNTIHELNSRGFREPPLQALLAEVERRTGVIDQGGGI
jgi:cation transport protein ChaC